MLKGRTSIKYRWINGWGIIDLWDRMESELYEIVKRNNVTMFDNKGFRFQPSPYIGLTKANVMDCYYRFEDVLKFFSLDELRYDLEGHDKEKIFNSLPKELREAHLTGPPTDKLESTNGHSGSTSNGTIVAAPVSEQADEITIGSDIGYAHNSKTRSATIEQLDNGWLIEFDGKKTICRTRGVAYIAFLIENHGKAFGLMKIGLLVEGPNPDALDNQKHSIEDGLEGIQGEAEEVIDEKARIAYHKEYKELKAEEEMAKRSGDHLHIAEATNELEKFVKALQKSYTRPQLTKILKDPSKPIKGQTREEKNERNRIVKLLNEAHKSIGKRIPALEQYLRNNIIYDNSEFTYSPEPKDRLEIRILPNP